MRNAAKTSGDIVDYLDGEIEWNGIPDEGRVTLVTPANAGYLRDTCGAYVSPGMVPRQMKAAFKAAGEKQLASVSMRSYTASVQDTGLRSFFKDVDMLIQGDGKHVWHSELVYYVDKYNLKLPEEFID